MMQTGGRTGMAQIQKDPALQDIQKNSQLVKDQYANLKRISVKDIEKYSALVVNVPIGDLSYKDAKRIIYVLASSGIKLKEQYEELEKENNELKEKLKASEKKA